MSEHFLDTKQTFLQVCYFLFGALCISFDGGYSAIFFALLLCSLPVLIQKNNRLFWNQNTKKIYFAFVFYALIQGVSIIWDTGTLREFDRPSRALMACAILLLCLRYPPRFTWLMNGIATGAIAAGIRALWDRQVMDYGRAFQWMMPIQGGDISMSLGILSLCGLMWAIHTAHHRHQIYYAIATVMGILGSILSSSRGGWILFPLILLVTYSIFRDWFSRNTKMSMAVALCLLVVFCALPQSGVPKRINDARSDISQYFSGGSKYTSLGLRFEFWKSALDSFVQKPIFGWGNHGVRQSQEQQYKRGLITKEAYEFNGHAHNQFLDEMAKRGLIGFAALIGLFLLPLSVFRTQLRVASTPESKTLAAGGILLVLSTIDYCLSQAFLNHNSGIIFFCLMVVLFFTASAHQQPTGDVKTS